MKRAFDLVDGTDVQSAPAKRARTTTSSPSLADVLRTLPAELWLELLMRLRPADVRALAQSDAFFYRKFEELRASTYFASFAWPTTTSIVRDAVSQCPVRFDVYHALHERLPPPTPFSTKDKSYRSLFRYVLEHGRRSFFYILYGEVLSRRIDNIPRQELVRKSGRYSEALFRNPDLSAIAYFMGNSYCNFMEDVVRQDNFEVFFHYFYEKKEALFAEQLIYHIGPKGPRIMDFIGYIPREFNVELFDHVARWASMDLLRKLAAGVSVPASVFQDAACYGTMLSTWSIVANVHGSDRSRLDLLLRWVGMPELSSFWGTIEVEMISDWDQLFQFAMWNVARAVHPVYRDLFVMHPTREFATHPVLSVNLVEHMIKHANTRQWHWIMEHGHALFAKIGAPLHEAYLFMVADNKDRRKAIRKRLLIYQAYSSDTLQVDILEKCMGGSCLSSPTRIRDAAAAWHEFLVTQGRATLDEFLSNLVAYQKIAQYAGLDFAVTRKWPITKEMLFLAIGDQLDTLPRPKLKKIATLIGLRQDLHDYVCGPLAATTN